MKPLTLLKIINLVNVLVSTGYAITGMVKPASILPPGVSINQSTTIFAFYAGARTIPLALLVLWAVIQKRNNALITLAVLAGVVQFLDGFTGIYQADIGKSVGPFVLAALQFGALWFWKDHSR